METASEGNPLAAMLSLWMLLQLVVLLALLIGGVYALYCLGRAASGLDRLASAVELLVQNNQSSATGEPGAPSPASTFSGLPPEPKSQNSPPSPASTLSAPPAAEEPRVIQVAPPVITAPPPLVPPHSPEMPPPGAADNVNRA